MLFFLTSRPRCNFFPNFFLHLGPGSPGLDAKVPGALGGGAWLPSAIDQGARPPGAPAQGARGLLL